MKPVIVQVFGDKTRKLEPEQHRIEFPGGYISIDRTTSGHYWAHIGLVDEIPETHQGKARGHVVGSRVDFDHDQYTQRIKRGLDPIPDIDGMQGARHFAVCIQPIWPERPGG